MARTVKHARLETPTARLRLKTGRQPHWQSLGPGGCHLGYQRKPGEPDGRWLFRRYAGGGNKYKVTALGRADDKQPANGRTTLSFVQAHSAARAMGDVPDAGKVYRLTVRQAMSLYMEHKLALGQSVADVKSRGSAYILPALGDHIVSELTAERLRKWLSNIANSPAQKRPTAKGKLQFYPEATTDEAIRKRKVSANRILIMLKAILNHAFDEGQVTNRDAWGRKLKAFPGVDQARTRYLTVAEAQRLMNACPPDFRALVRAGLESGARYSELGRLEVSDFNPDAGTLHIRKSKTNRARFILLTPQGSEFFRKHCAGKPGSARMFTKADGSVWQKDAQDQPMRDACAAATIEPRLGFHQLRHTWASLSVMNGMPLLLVARNLGHTDIKQVQKTYAHLAPDYMAQQIRDNAPRFEAEDTNVIPLKI